jgi:hypothetical protein
MWKEVHMPIPALHDEEATHKDNRIERTKKEYRQNGWWFLAL